MSIVKWEVVWTLSNQPSPHHPLPDGVTSEAWQPFGTDGNGRVCWRRPHHLKKKKGLNRQAGLKLDAQSACPDWAVAAARSNTTHTAGDVLAAVVACIEQITQRLIAPARAKTSATPIIRLWKALGRPDLTVFTEDVRMVATAARDCPAQLFARDIRAEGWPDGVDRSKSVATLCVQSKWDERLATAKDWVADGSVRSEPSTTIRGDSVSEDDRDGWRDGR